MAVPNIFAPQSGIIPLAQLDVNFATPVTLGITPLQLGNTVLSITGLTNVGSSTFTGALVGNADTVTNGVYTIGNQTINGIKTFSSTINGNALSATTAATVIDGVYTVGDQTINGVKTFGSTILGSISGVTGTFSGAVSGTTGTFSGAVSGTTGTFSGNVQMASLNGGAVSLRNKIINGDMRIAQRGAGPFALTTTYSYLTVDRFFAVMATSAAGGMQQNTDAPTGFVNSLYFYRNAASALTGGLGTGQVVETLNIYDLKGQTVTFSFYAKAAANFSASGSSLSSQVITGTAANATSATLGSWTGQAATNQANTITTTWTKYSMTATIPSGALSLAVLLQWTPVGTAGASDGVFVTGLQLEVGPVATPFEQIPYGLSLQLCQRYFQKSYQASTAPGTNTNLSIISGYASDPTRVTGVVNRFPVVMRTQPNTQIYSETGSLNQVSTTTGANTGSTMIANLVGDAGFGEITGTGLTVNTAVRAHWTASAEL